jgi:hypothetical protein
MVQSDHFAFRSKPMPMSSDYRGRAGNPSGHWHISLCNCAWCTVAQAEIAVIAWALCRPRSVPFGRYWRRVRAFVLVCAELPSGVRGTEYQRLKSGTVWPLAVAENVSVCGARR